ncbi:MAG: glycoside hydrolase family 3 C-terminal domain-containing protein [Clostridia bacterium]|nr:glycoside hydrolase family 3 C-terminal domain-containing protein [Clostridia bacterium]
MGDYRDPKMDVDARVNDLLDRMTLEEMIFQTDQYASNDITTRDEKDGVLSVDMEKLDRMLRGNSVGSIQARGLTPAQSNMIQRYAVEKTRLGIPFLFCEEALHGLGHHTATVFPQQLGLAATFDPALGRRMGHAIATEARALGVHETWNPVLDLARDPRYGRTEETYGEDTFLGAAFAREVVTGMQGKSLADPDAVASEPKHFAAYGTPVAGLNCAPSAMGRHEVYSDALPIFEAAIADAGAVDVMCSYTSLDGVPMAADHELLTDVLRGQWGMRGFVRADMTAVARLYDNHFVASSRKEAMAMGMEAGVDLPLYDFPHDEWQQGLKEQVESGRLDISVLRQAAGRVLRVKFLLGLFDRPYVDEGLAAAVVHTPEHIALSSEIARESVVLLKNEGGLLPLRKDLGTIAVLGPSAGQAMMGDYRAPGKIGVSILDGVRALAGPDTKVLYDPGCYMLGDRPEPIPTEWLTDENGNPGLTGRYYRGLRFEGDPVMTRTDRRVSFSWLYVKPCEEVDGYSYSVVWTGRMTPKETLDGFIGFYTWDSMRLYIDGELILDGWGDGKTAGRTIPFHFEKDRAHDVRIEFASDHRGGRVVFGMLRRREDFTPAVEMAKKADVAIVCVGDSDMSCGENLDRMTLDLPGRQSDFVKAVAATGTPVVLVLQTGRPASIVWAQEHIPAILEAWFPGEEGGFAVADTLFGANNPSGRLPISFPKHVGQIPCHYTRRPGGGRVYVEMDDLPLYPFGYGLSYTSFAYGNLALSRETIAAGESIEASMEVTNTGAREGVAVPQLYICDCFASVVKPRMALCAFGRVPLRPGETRRVTFSIGPRSMRTLGRDFTWRVEPGEFSVILASDAEHPIMSCGFRVE